MRQGSLFISRLKPALITLFMGGSSLLFASQFLGPFQAVHETEKESLQSSTHDDASDDQTNEVAELNPQQILQALPGVFVSAENPIVRFKEIDVDRVESAMQDARSIESSQMVITAPPAQFNKLTDHEKTAQKFDRDNLILGAKLQNGLQRLLDLKTETNEIGNITFQFRFPELEDKNYRLPENSRLLLALYQNVGPDGFPNLESQKILMREVKPEQPQFIETIPSFLSDKPIYAFSFLTTDSSEEPLLGGPELNPVERQEGINIFIANYQNLHQKSVSRPLSFIDLCKSEETSEKFEGAKIYINGQEQGIVKKDETFMLNGISGNDYRIELQFGENFLVTTDTRLTDSDQEQPLQIGFCSSKNQSAIISTEPFQADESYATPVKDFFIAEMQDSITPVTNYSTGSLAGRRVLESRDSRDQVFFEPNSLSSQAQTWKFIHRSQVTGLNNNIAAALYLPMGSKEFSNTDENGEAFFPFSNHEYIDVLSDGYMTTRWRGVEKLETRELITPASIQEIDPNWKSGGAIFGQIFPEKNPNLFGQNITIKLLGPEDDTPKDYKTLYFDADGVSNGEREATGDKKASFFIGNLEPGIYYVLAYSAKDEFITSQRIVISDNVLSILKPSVGN